MTLTKRQSNMFHIVKAFALIFIVVSHMSFEKKYVIAESIRGTLGQIGVFVYFFCSGFFYSRKVDDSKLFWMGKLKSIILPWWLYATLTFCLTLVLSSDYTGILLRYLKWILGLKSVYWYMLMLVLCYMVFKFIYNKDFWLYLCILVSVLSVYLSAFKIVEISQYVNILDWIGVFAFGIIIRRKNLIDKLCSIPIFLVSLVLCVVFVWLSAIRGISIKSYIDVYSLPVETMACFVIFGLSNALYKSKVLIDVGKKSFFIYLVHIQIAGVINTRLPNNVLFFMLRPIVVIVACYCIEKCIQSLLKAMGLYEKFGKILALR